MSESVVQVETESGGTYDAVDRDRLHALVETIGDTNGYVILERSDRPEQYAQAACARTTSGQPRPGFVVEYRDGPKSHHQADAADHETVLAVLAGWAFDEPGWKDAVAWRALDLGF